VGQHGLQQAVHFTGFVTVEDFVPLCMACEVFVLPSHSEGFGLLAVEAMACGAPVLASNVGTITDEELGEIIFDYLKRASIPLKTHPKVVVTRRLSHAYPIYT
jgi:glycosyltransferase involved in cell wall biosynthesis